MGKRGGWFSAVRKAFSCESKQNREKKNRKSGRWVSEAKEHRFGFFGGGKCSGDSCSQSSSYKRAAVAAAHAAAEVVRLPVAPHNMGTTKQQIAATNIPAVFRGFMARRALRALRGLVRLKTLIGGQSVKRQAASTLKCIQTLSRVQSEIRARRIRMSEENSAIQRQIQQKHEKELEKSRAASIGSNWDDSVQSKEQVEANLQYKQEAAMRRERALAYAYSHQATESKRTAGTDDESRGVNSMQSERGRRHSVAGAAVRDDESFSSSPALPGYLATTESARAKSRVPSP
ncbi:hypothetical protein RD792_000004 [Penstemon davidsonii]|uniref:DUF4005 domain-containing protein n=1 Tax=Penstemon davidsonii TaxID=160366 RepID=A0ABR0DWK8_9LAMI|nr:hypothetical protein RD792_000004 [Penstemon davidsonii]